ncbi:hypothetical protein F5Y05DRAFT_277179 [Hypoxylon sp. FL0543]|nr:hypothetical protein F5Y05DRAFT_277179 [Hypoxylon sp. FL0543]
MQRSKHKQKSSRPRAEPQWSEPKWHDQYQQWYSERQGQHGTIEYTWIGPTLPNASDQSVPRSGQAINVLEEGMRNLNVDQSGYDTNQYPDYASHHAAAVDQASYTHDAHHSQEPSYLDHTQTQQQTNKGKGKSVGVEQQEEYDSPPFVGNPAQISDEVPLPQDDYGQEAQAQYSTSDYLSAGTAAVGPSMHVAEPQLNDFEPEITQSYDNDAEYQEALRRSRSNYYGTQGAGEPSYSTSSADTAASSSWPPAVDPNAYDLNVMDGEDVPTPRGGSPVQVTTIPSAPAYNYIHGTPGEEEVLDSRYKVERSTRFQPGEVFKILWSEPLGQVSQAGPDDPISDLTKRRTPGGSKFYIGYRRFIIVTTDESHHSTCVPILTYDRRGCLKKGVRASKHGIIYTAGSKPPKPLKNEPTLGFQPVALQVYTDGETLAKESRVNYSKLVTIEHNVKVFFIGSIAPQDFEIVRYAVEDCWNNKIHRSKRSSRR